jgi:NAD(P)-dependent dehydrogenase (short-subunit alcohol dehydrogenase family)
MLLKDKFAVISGAATENGIGYATARVFAEHGVRRSKSAPEPS